MRYRVVNLLGQPLQTTPYSQAQRQHLPCPDLPAEGAPPESCAQVSDGGIICEDGTYYPSYCAAPRVTEPSLAPYVQSQGFYVPQPPAKASLEAETGTAFPWLAVGISAASIVGSILFS